MPPKRKSKRQAAKKPEPEPEVAQETPVEEPVQEEVKEEAKEEVKKEIKEEPQETAVEEKNDEMEDIADPAKEEADDDAEEEAPEAKPELTFEEKIENLDKLSKAHPFALLEELTYKANTFHSKFTYIENKIDDISYTKCIARFEKLKVVIPKIPPPDMKNNNKHSKERQIRKMATKIAADLLLHKIYGDDHELEEITVKVKEQHENQEDKSNPENQIIFSEDEEWYNDRLEEHKKSLQIKAEKFAKITRDNDKLNDEIKAKKLARIEERKEVKDYKTISYDDLYVKFEHVYFKVLNNVLYDDRSRKLTYHFSVSYLDDNQQKVVVSESKKNKEGKNKKRTNEEANSVESADTQDTAENENKPDLSVSRLYSIQLMVKKEDEKLVELSHEMETDNIAEIKSEAAYKMLHQLLQEKIIPSVQRRLLGHQGSKPSTFNNNNRSYGKNNWRGGFSSRPGGQSWFGNRGRGGNNNRGRGNNSNNRGRGRGNFRGGSRGRGNFQNGGNRGNFNQNRFGNTNNNNMPMMPNMGQNMQQGQYMMMPVMMGPNGQMMIPNNFGQMMGQNNNKRSKQN